MIRQWLDARNAHVWTTLGHAVLLAHLAADKGLTQYTEQFLAELEPFADRIAIIGQVGVVGPVALAIARLYAASDDIARAAEFNAIARDIATRTGGIPSALRCRLLDCQLRPPSVARAADVSTIIDAATSIGMNGLVTEARRLVAGA